MKKILMGMLATAALLSVSCQKAFNEGGVSPDGTATVSVSLSFPTIQTRAYSDGTTATNLQYAVYEGGSGSTLKKIAAYTKTNETINISKKVDFQLVTGRTYTFVFWAGAPSENGWDSPYAVDFGENGATMTATYSNAITSNTMANDERLDAFFASVEKTITGDVQMSVELTRPFAQINVGTSDLEVAKEMGVAPNRSYIIVKDAHKKLDLVSGNVMDEASSIQFAYGQIAGTTYDNNKKEAEAFPVLGYDYLAMAYVLASQDPKVAEVDFGYVKDKDTDTRVVRTVGSVPIQRNHRTNMFGQVLTSNASLNIIIKPEYEEPDYNYDQLLFAAAVGGTAVLEDDVTMNFEDIIVKKDAVINLNGNSIIFEGDPAQVEASKIRRSQLVVRKDAHLTIEGPGTIETTGYGNSPIYVDGGSVTIKGGTFNAQAHGEAILIGSNGGTVTIEGGTFWCYYGGVNNEFALNCNDDAFKSGKAEFIVKGGTFYGFDPANSSADKKDSQNVNWVAPGYKSVLVAENQIYEGDKSTDPKYPRNVYMVVPDDTDIISVPTDMSQDNFNDAITKAADNAIFYLGDNVELTLPSKSVENKNFTFVGNGADKSIIKDLNHETATGSNLTFENMTLKVAKGGSATSLGFNGAESITLKNVTVKGEFHTFSAKSAVFEGCTFNFDGVNTTDRQGIWCEAYGKTVIKDCIFEVIPPDNNGNETKAILIYSDYNFEMGDVEVTNCTFNKGVVSAKACVEIHSEKFKSAGTVTITGCTWDEETYEGGLWREIYNVNGPDHQKGDPTQFYTVIVNGEVKQTGTK